MKDSIKIGLSIMLCVAILASCSNNGAPTNNEDSKVDTTVLSDTRKVETTTTSASTTEVTTTEPEIKEFMANEDISVIASFIYDNDNYMVVHNTGDTPILDIKVSYIAFDSNGFTIDDDGYETVRATAINLMPGAKYCVSSYGSYKGKYLKGVVTYVKYKDGTEWEASDINVWQDDIIKNFDVSAYKAEIDALKGDGEKALSNEYVDLYDVSFENRNQFSTDSDFIFSVKNKTDIGVRSVLIYVLEFDENGMPVSVSPYDTYCVNGHYTGGIVNLGADKSKSFSDDLLIDGSTKNLKYVVEQIIFNDDTTWENPYFYEWMITNHNSY